MGDNFINPFEESPEALVDDFLNKSKEVGDILKKQFNDITLSRDKIRAKIRSRN